MARWLFKQAHPPHVRTSLCVGCAHLHNHRAGAASPAFPVSFFGRSLLNRKYYTNRVINVLKSHMGERRQLDRRPLFVFSCGGEEGSSHPARRDLKRYIDSSNLPSLDNVVCLKAEVIAKDRVFEGWDLLTQEAAIADVADWLVIFVESPGSYAELGAFASLPHVRSITSVAVGSKYRGSQSFLLKGPVETIAREDKQLSKVFYLELMCPLMSDEFTGFIDNLRGNVRKSERERINRGRKNLNKDESSINLGSLVHELLDLVYLCAPIAEDDLIDLYCRVKEFKRKGIRIQSWTLANDMGDSAVKKIAPHQVVSFMVSSGMLRSDYNKRMDANLLSCNIMLHDYFMFKSSGSGELADLRKQMVLDKRRDGVGAAFYRGID